MARLLLAVAITGIVSRPAAGSRETATMTPASALEIVLATAVRNGVAV